MNVFSVIIIVLIAMVNSSVFSEDNFKQQVEKALKKIYQRTYNKSKPWLDPVYFQREDFVFPVVLTEAQWRERLSDFEYYILREQGTERAYTGTYDKFYEKGTYYSVATGQPLFSSEDKFDSKTGWPSFTKPISKDAVNYRLDASLFSTRIEVVDSLSGSHLGHVFEDGPDPTRLRYCMNSAALLFVPEGQPVPEILTARTVAGE